MALTWADIQTQVLANLGKQGDSTTIALLPGWAAIEQLAMQLDRNFWFLKTSAYRTIDQNAQTYGLPANFKEELVFYLILNANPPSQYKELFQISDLDVLRIYVPDSSAQFRGEPVEYTMAGQSITLWPWPQQAYTLKMVGWKDIDPPVASSPGSFTNMWISKYNKLFIARLTAAGWMYLQQYDDARQWMTTADEELKRLRAAHVSRELGDKITLTPSGDAYGVTSENLPIMYWLYQ